MKTASVQKIGTVTSSGTIGVVEFAPSVYNTLTVDNFFVIIKSVGAGTAPLGGDGKLRGHYSGFTVKKSYDQSTGILTISGLTSTVYLWGGNGDYGVTSATIKIKADVYLVIGDDMSAQ